MAKNTTIQLLRGTGVSKSDVLADGEQYLDKATGNIYIGDGESTIATLSTMPGHIIVSKTTINTIVDSVNTKMDKNNPTGTGSFSLNRSSGTTIGDYSVAIGDNTQASGMYAMAEGCSTKAVGKVSHAEGEGTQASGTYGAHSEGYYTLAIGDSSHSEGCGGTNSIKLTGAEDAVSYIASSTVDTNKIGRLLYKSDTNKYAIITNVDTNNNSITVNETFGEALNNTSIQILSGVAYGNYSHAEGRLTTASGTSAHAEGATTVAAGPDSHAEGISTVASGSHSHAEGNTVQAIGSSSHAEGIATIASTQAQHVFGEYNIADSSVGANVRGAYVEIVGNGGINQRSNARTLDWNGNEWLAGGITVGNHIKPQTDAVETTHGGTKTFTGVDLGDTEHRIANIYAGNISAEKITATIEGVSENAIGDQDGNNIKASYGAKLVHGDSNDTIVLCNKNENQLSTVVVNNVHNATNAEFATKIGSENSHPQIGTTNLPTYVNAAGEVVPIIRSAERGIDSNTMVKDDQGHIKPGYFRLATAVLNNRHRATKAKVYLQDVDSHDYAILNIDCYIGGYYPDGTSVPVPAGTEVTDTILVNFSISETSNVNFVDGNLFILVTGDKTASSSYTQKYLELWYCQTDNYKRLSATFLVDIANSRISAADTIATDTSPWSKDLRTSAQDISSYNSGASSIDLDVGFISHDMWDTDAMYNALKNQHGFLGRWMAYCQKFSLTEPYEFVNNKLNENTQKYEIQTNIVSPNLTIQEACELRLYQPAVNFYDTMATSHTENLYFMDKTNKVDNCVGAVSATVGPTWNALTLKLRSKGTPDPETLSQLKALEFVQYPNTGNWAFSPADKTDTTAAIINLGQSTKRWKGVYAENIYAEIDGGTIE